MPDYENMSKQGLISELEKLHHVALAKDPEDVERLLHELQVHQIELEMQNRQLHETQEELRQSKELYAELFDFAPVGYAMFDDKGGIRMANLVLAEMLGVERSQLIGSFMHRYILPADKPLFGQLLQNWQTAGEPHAAVLNMVKKDGSFMVVEMHVKGMKDRAGDQTDLKAAVTDITESTRMHEKLVEQMDKLERFNRVLVTGELRLGQLKEEVAKLKAENARLKSGKE